MQTFPLKWGDAPCCWGKLHVFHHYTQYPQQGKCWFPKPFKVRKAYAPFSACNSSDLNQASIYLGIEFLNGNTSDKVFFGGPGHNPRTL